MQKNRTEIWQEELSVDFSAESENKEKIKQTLLRQLSMQDAATPAMQKEESTMNQNSTKRFKRSTVIALAACLTLAVLSVTAYAVYNFLNLGQYAQYEVGSDVDEAAMANEPVPEEIQGKLYDKDGNLIETVGQMQALDAAYNADGEQVITTNDENNKLVIVTMEEALKEQKELSTLFNTLEEAQAYLAFEAREIPYVPAGYELEGYRIYNDENGQPEKDTKYMEMYLYKNGSADEFIYVQVRLMDEESAYASTGSNDMEKTTINGYEAVVYGNNVDILVDDVMYMFMGDLTKDEAIKMAEALTEK